jgi:photosystem II stability/assembly factor-like uncharacterized protein
MNPGAPVLSWSAAQQRWQRYETPEKWGLQSIEFVDSHSGWAAGVGGIIHTVDAGQTWSYQLEMDYSMFVDLFFLNRSLGWALQYNGTVYRYQIR